MKQHIKNKKYLNRYLAATLAVTILSVSLVGCGRKADIPTKPPVGQEASNSTDTTDITDPSNESDTNNVTLSFKPAESGMLAKEQYDFPYMGLSAKLTDAMLNKMKSYDVTMIGNEEPADDGTLGAATLSWYALTEEQKELEVTSLDSMKWTESLSMIGTLGVYNSEYLSQIDALSGCSEHKELGKSEDGKYTYMLSLADSADSVYRKELEKSEITLTAMEPVDYYMGNGAFSEARVETNNVGSFSTTDVNGTSYTNDYFSQYDLTLVNAFTTWCSPCIGEMPDLEKFKQEMESRGIGMASFALDTVSGDGEENTSAIELAQQLIKKVGLTFPILKPDAAALNGRLKGIDSFPESFFVDRNGNIVGDTYAGTRSFQEWKEIAEKELANLKSMN